MLPLTVDDLIPLQTYASRRKEFFDTHRRYVDKFRRVRIGPKLTLLFENRQTLWYRVQEVIRIARLVDAREVQLELNLYNRLLPSDGTLQAALLIELGDAAPASRDATCWHELTGEQLQLELGATALSSHLVTCRAEDRCAGTAHWVQFTLSDRERDLLANLAAPAAFRFDNGHYSHTSEPLTPQVRLSLCDDLDLSRHESLARPLAG